MKQENKELDYWRSLAERYYEAETTDAEENELKRFLATDLSVEFDDLRAVMGYAVVGKRMCHASSSVKTRKITMQGRPVVWIAAACVAAVLVVTTVLNVRSDNEYMVAYVDGQRTTDPNVVMAMMQNTMADMYADNGSVDIESQMADMFEVMNADINE